MAFKQGDFIGSYQIIEQVGRGGMATVYRAHQPSLNREVAIKVLHPFFATDPDFKERFSREASIVARLRHPNIVTIYDYGEEADDLYIVMEFVQSNLSARMDDALSLDAAITLLQPVADALDYAHRHEVVHRDVKPANILLDSDGAPILTDFGLSWIGGSLSRLTHTGVPLGTPQYMAPEIANGKQSVPSVDLYAFAVITYEILTGQLPYNADSPIAILMAHVNQPLPPASQINKSLSEEVDAVLQRALEKDPDARYATARDFIDALAATRGPQRQQAESSKAPEQDVEAERISYGALFDAALDEPATAPTANPWPSAVLETLQLPEVLLPLAVASLAMIYFLLLSPQLGFSLTSLAGALVMLACVVKYALKHLGAQYDRAVERASREQQQRREQAVHQQLRQVVQSLDDGFTAVESKQGSRVLRQLKNEFEHWQAPQYQRDASDPLAMVLVPQLVLETYRRGISALGDALALSGEASSSDAERLNREAIAIEQELQQGVTDANLRRQKQALLASHRERVAGIAELTRAEERLFFQAELCEAALHKGRMDVVGLRNGGHHGSVDGVIQALQKTIRQVKEVQDEVRRLGY